MDEAHCSCFVAFLALFECRVPYWKWNLAVFDVSSQGHDLVGVHFSLIKFLLHSKAELDIDESRQVIQLMHLLLETLSSLPLVSPYVALPLLGNHSDSSFHVGVNTTVVGKRSSGCKDPPKGLIHHEAAWCVESPGITRDSM